MDESANFHVAAVNAADRALETAMDDLQDAPRSRTESTIDDMLRFEDESRGAPYTPLPDDIDASRAVILQLVQKRGEGKC
jgi:plasmid stabilization system protein ParE